MGLFLADGKKITRVVLEGPVEVFGLSELRSLAVNCITCLLVDDGKLVRSDTYDRTFI